MRVATGSERLGRPDRRRPSTTLHMIGLALVFSAAGLALSLAVELAVGGRQVAALGWSTAVVGMAGAALWRSTRLPGQVPTAVAFAAVSWTWVAVSAFGALPYVLSGVLPRLDDALFESVSGFTATGSTVLSPIEGTSRGILFWRQLTQWYGGMGMIVLAVAVLPFLGVGGLELIQAEAPGPSSDRLAPRVSETAKRLWLIYAGLTGLTALGLLLVGTSLYDAIAHAVTAVATGGFSPYNDSIFHFDSVAVEVVLMAGMLAGAANFTLHWRAATGDPGGYWRTSEFRLYAAVVVGATAAVTLLNVGDGMAVGRALRDSAFNVVSMITTTGFGTADFVQWVAAAQLILLLLMIVGGMAGSTSGAVKLLRVQVMVRHALRELRRARHPAAVLPVKLGSVAVPEPVVSRIAGFVLLYFLVGVVAVLALAALGTDLPTSVGSVATAIGGVGPGLGETGPASNFLAIARPARLVVMVLMLLGRLEIVPMLLMFAVLTRPRRPRRQRRAAPVRPGHARPGER